jgi:hypothetical protein
MVQTPNGVIEANVGDYIVEDEHETYHVYAPNKFLEKYDKA